MSLSNSLMLNVLSVSIISILATGCGGGNSSSDPTKVKGPSSEGQNTPPTTVTAPDPSTLPPKDDVTVTETVTEEVVQTVTEEVVVTKPTAAEYVSTDADLAFYDAIDTNKLQEVKLADGRTMVTLDDTDLGYAGFGGKLKDINTQQVALLQVGVLQVSDDDIKKLKKASEYYTGKVEDILQQQGASTNVLVNQTNINSQSTAINIVLDVNFSSDMTANEVRNFINQAVNGNQNYVSSITQTGNKFRVTLSYWLNDSNVMFWSSSYLTSEADAVNAVYGDINSTVGLTGSKTLGTEVIKETFKQKSTNASKGIDILWSIDASGSMYEEQTNLANGAEQFFNELSNAGVDYRLAVNTQGYSCTNLRKLNNGVDSFIDNNTNNAKEEWRALSRPGTGDSGTETGFYCVDNVDTSTFDRPEADNIVIFVSDEPENETVKGNTPKSADYTYSLKSFSDYKNDFLNTSATYFAIAGTGSVIKPQLDSNVDLYANNDFYCNGQGGEAEGGAHFKDVAIASGGSYASICSDASSWSVMFDQILKAATGLASSFELNDIPIAPTAKVTINGAEVPRDPSHKNGYDIIYSNGKSSIVFYGNYVPTQGDAIEIGYSKAIAGTGIGTNTEEIVLVTKEETVLVEKEVVKIVKPKRVAIR